MNKKKIETLQEIKRKALKIVTLTKKIDESDKLGMSHRHEEYLQSLDDCIEQLNGLYSEIKKE